MITPLPPKFEPGAALGKSNGVGLLESFWDIIELTLL